MIKLQERASPNDFEIIRCLDDMLDMYKIVTLQRHRWRNDIDVILCVGEPAQYQPISSCVPGCNDVIRCMQFGQAMKQIVDEINDHTGFYYISALSSRDEDVHRSCLQQCKVHDAADRQVNA